MWHERWGEDYDGNGGDACVKWTDKWAERLLPGGAREQWGDKWTESFGDGRGTKHGEVRPGGLGGGPSPACKHAGMQVCAHRGHFGRRL